MAALTDEKLKEFVCMQCGACCRQAGFVYLENGEAEKIAGFLGMDIYDFTEKYCEVENRQKLVLKKYSDESCVMLKENRCSIHPVKPVQCRDFPVKWRTPKSLEYCAGLRKLIDS